MHGVGTRLLLSSRWVHVLRDYNSLTKVTMLVMAPVLELMSKTVVSPPTREYVTMALSVPVWSASVAVTVRRTAPGATFSRSSPA